MSKFSKARKARLARKRDRKSYLHVVPCSECGRWGPSHYVLMSTYGFTTWTACGHFMVHDSLGDIVQIVQIVEL